MKQFELHSLFPQTEIRLFLSLPRFCSWFSEAVTLPLMVDSCMANIISGTPISVVIINSKIFFTVHFYIVSILQAAWRSNFAKKIDSLKWNIDTTATSQKKLTTWNETPMRIVCSLNTNSVSYSELSVMIFYALFVLPKTEVRDNEVRL